MMYFIVGFMGSVLVDLTNVSPSIAYLFGMITIAVVAYSK